MSTSDDLLRAVDTFTRAVDTLLPEDTDPAALHIFREALGTLLAVALGAASAQSASSVLAVREELDRRLDALERERGA